MPRQEREPGAPRGFWSGTIAFGLVSVPVSLFVANRPSRVALRMVGEDGTPLTRVYVCSRDEEPLDRDDIVRGYELEKDRFVVIEDEELEAIAPEKTQEINLERFVEVDAIDPVYFERAYFLAPGRGGSRPYRLLAQAMEDTGRAGIATFVMRGKEYLVAIIAERGILRGEILRFHDELRTPETLGLPEVPKPATAEVKKMERAIRKLHADELLVDALSDRQSERILEVVQQKLDSGEDVVQAPEGTAPSEAEGAEIIDLMTVLKQSVEQESDGAPRKGKQRRRTSARGPRAAGRAGDLGSRSKTELYERARRLDIPGRSSMSKEELIRALQDAR